MTGEKSEGIALDLVMGRMSDHLDTLAAKVFEIEEAIGEAISSNGTADQDGATITRLQSLDFLRQSIEDLALLACYLSRHSKRTIEGEFPVEVLSDGLKLDTTRAIVAGPLNGKNGTDIKDLGDLDLF